MEYLPRDLEGEVENALKERKMVVIEGPRRSGKTTLLKALHKRLGGEYISFDDPHERRAFLRNPIGYVEGMEGIVFLDEIQRLGKEGGLALKRVYDETEKIVVATGSGAFSVVMELKAYLVGRARFLHLLPLSFGEFILWKAPKRVVKRYEEGHKQVEGLLKGQPLPAPEVWEGLQPYWEEYVLYGGYPEVVLHSSKEAFLRDIVDSVIEEDLIRFFHFREGEKFWRVVERLAALHGSLLELSSLGVKYETAEEYVAALRYSYCSLC